MLSDELVRRLSGMPYRADAERRISYLPLSSIYWTDELNDTVDDLFEDGNTANRDALLALFRIRMKLWTTTPLAESEQRFLDEARAQVPEYALFRRMEISPEELQMHYEVAGTAHDFWQEFFGVPALDAEPVG